jgi:ABC-2 type transport system permease protein
MRSFSQEAAQLGTLVVVIATAACIALEAHPALAIFYRTRIRRPVMLLLPRSTATAVTAMLALGLGTAAAWYETRLLIGYVSPAALVAGCGLEMLWMAFIVAVVTAWAAVVRSVLAVVGWSLATLLVLALLDSISSVSSWLPTALSSGIQDLLPGNGRVPWQGVGIAVGATLGLLVFATRLTAVRRLDR